MNLGDTIKPIAWTKWLRPQRNASTCALWGEGEQLWGDGEGREMGIPHTGLPISHTNTWTP